MMESGSATTSASYVSTRGCIPSGPMNLWVFRSFKQSLTQSSSTKVKSSSICFIRCFRLIFFWCFSLPFLTFLTSENMAATICHGWGFVCLFFCLFFPSTFFTCCFLSEFIYTISSGALLWADFRLLDRWIEQVGTECKNSQESR